ncbi:related to Protein LTV1 [Saccharomycodes ludwigii]|uniref:Related to Protein LTV1 n=1 Tax=Saccharomycodes ludwigii TaxID=36035 RepID=A0A376B349_9ASCO|nr:hypothetical protein SCDLUD_004777 [Saccharomycodes ludwigii]KAH3899338.1 hypothetical protein SCDLUD_004777 [Saccharomycodes ludwigii]SSD59115.1 related to Protein LTV1 [Saccharomycodes ludwigii]
MSSNNKFNNKSAKKFAIVHRPHDDPKYYDSEASQNILIPVENPNKAQKVYQNPLRKIKKTQQVTNWRVGEAALYGIGFDDSSYDYTQHLKPIGVDPEHSIFIAKDDQKQQTTNKNIEDLFVEPQYKSMSSANNTSVFDFGKAKPEYLEHQVEIADELRGFKPDMDPALREVLEALEDEAYVINDDIVVTEHIGKAKKDGNAPMEGEKEGEEFENSDELLGSDDDIFAELLGSGETNEMERQEILDEWDMDNYDEYGDQNIDLSKIDGNLSNFNEAVDWSADVSQFKREQKILNKNEVTKINDDLESQNDFVEDEEEDQLGDLPTFKGNTKSQKKKQRRKKGAMSDSTGFSMSSSALARTEVMTVLDDKYDQIIDGYENYEDELEETADEIQEFDMKMERPDLESLVDEFLDTYELESGGRKLVKKNREKDILVEAADSVSKGKVSIKRNKLRQKNSGDVTGITTGLSSLKF